MTGDRAAEIAFYALALLLPLSALVARRIATRRVLLLAGIWIAIFAVVATTIGLWQRHERATPPPSNKSTIFT